MGPIDQSEQIEIALDRGAAHELPFYCVSAAKLSILSFATFGLYEVFWFYKNWVLVKARTGRDIYPFWRAVFSAIFCYPFATATDSAAESVHSTQRISPAPIAVVYFGLLFLERLPDPYWLICLFSFVPLLPIVNQIRAIHESIQPGFDSTVGWTAGSFVALVLGGSMTGLAVLATLGPPTQALRHEEIPASYQATLLEAGVLEPGEQIDFFYTAGLFSILEDGNLLTPRRVISYERVEGELFIASSTYPEIRDLDVQYSTSDLEDTVITVTTGSEEEFLLVVSPEDGRDKEFVSTLEARREREP